MRAAGLAALALLVAGAALAQPTVRRALNWLEQRGAELRSGVPRVPLLLSFRDDFNRGRTWEPEDVVALLRRDSTSFLALGWLSGYSIGSPLYRGVGRRVDRWQEAIAAWNAAHEPQLDAGRLCIDWRPDLVWKHVDGREGERSCGTLLGEDQCAPEPCYAHEGNPCTRWEGDMARDWGAAARFDPAWLARMPAARWDAIVAKYYEGQDLCSGRGHVWGDATDRGATCRANAPDGKLVLYGKADPKRKRLNSVSGVALDLRIPEAREWNARRLLSQLVALGFGPGEPACVILAYKPGLWSFYDGPGAGRRCPSAEANSWAGFETPANAVGCGGAPLAPTPYGAGEFERSMNEQMRVLFRLLESPVPEAIRQREGGGVRWGALRFVTTERPETRGRIWWIWEADVRARLLGEMDNRGTGLE